MHTSVCTRMLMTLNFSRNATADGAVSAVQLLHCVDNTCQWMSSRWLKLNIDIRHDTVNLISCTLTASRWQYRPADRWWCPSLHWSDMSETFVLCINLSAQLTFKNENQINSIVRSCFYKLWQLRLIHSLPLFIYQNHLWNDFPSKRKDDNSSRTQCKAGLNMAFWLSMLVTGAFQNFDWFVWYLNCVLISSVFYCFSLYRFNDIAANVRRVCVQLSQEFLVNHPDLVKDIAGNIWTSLLVLKYVTDINNKCWWGMIYSS